MKSHKSEVAITWLLFVHQPTRKQCRLSPEMNTWTPATTVNKQPASAGTLGEKGLPAQHTTFNTLDNWGHKTPTQSKRKRTGKKRYCRRWCSSTLDGSWRMGSSVVGRLTNIAIPVNSWVCPSHFGLMSQERSGTTSASARDALWCHALGKRKGMWCLVWSFGNALCLYVNGLP